MAAGGTAAGGLWGVVGTVLDVLWSAEAATFRGSVERAEHAIFKRGRFDLLSGDPPPYPTTVRLLGEDGGVGHAVTIVGEWIFDATLPHALPLSKMVKAARATRGLRLHSSSAAFPCVVSASRVFLRARMCASVCVVFFPHRRA